MHFLPVQLTAYAGPTHNAIMNKHLAQNKKADLRYHVRNKKKH
jgi:hypothetical protein